MNVLHARATRFRAWQILALAILTLICSATSAEAWQNNSITLEFVDAQRGRSILASEDDFLTRLSPFDLQSRMQSKTPVTREEYVAFVGKEVRDWSDAQKAAVREAFALVKPAIESLVPKGLPTVEVIHTTGREEAGAAYTRGKAIVLPTGRLEVEKGELAKLLAHELFHVISRNNPMLRDGLYATIGFERIGEIKFPPKQRDLQITNPDAPVIQHAIRLRGEDGEAIWAAPVLFADRPYDPDQARRMFAYLQFQLLELTKPEGDSFRPAMKNDKMRLHSPNHPDFGRQIGRNTGYIIHPEEILADNFADLVTGRRDAPDPWVTEKMRAVFAVHANR